MRYLRYIIFALLTILALLILGFGGFAGYYFLTEGMKTPFAETIMFVMTLVALLVALSSFGIWTALRRFLHEDIAREITGLEERTRNEALARIAAKVAYAFWEFYIETKNNVYRDQAIKIVSDARDILEGREEMGREDLECRIYNNLAFGYAERGQVEDTATAHFLVNKMMDRIKHFPSREANWLETYAYVLYKLPKKPADKEEALAIIKELLQRSDIKDGTKSKYRERYSISDV